MTEPWPVAVACYLACIASPVVAWKLAEPADPEPWLRWCVGLCLGLFAIPLAAYSLAVLFATHMSTPLLLAVGAGTVVVGWLIGLRRRGAAT